MIQIKDVNYFPVLNGGLLNCATRQDEGMIIDGKRLTFYTKDAMFVYPKFLINPFHHMKLFVEVEKRGLLLDDALIIADSGGLQEISLQEKRYDVEEVFTWQQEHSNIGFCMDSLPYVSYGCKGKTVGAGPRSGWYLDKPNFIKHAEKTKDNINRTRPIRNREKYPDFWFYGIIQGTCYDENKRWFNVINDEDYLDGFCLTAINQNPMVLAEAGIFALNHIKKPIHFLGMGNLSRSIVLYYLGRYFKHGISYDSSSYDIGGQFRSFLLPFLPSKKLRFVSDHKMTNDNKDELTSVKDIKQITDANRICDCDACRLMKGKTMEMIKSNDPKLGSLISMHNLILSIKLNNYTEEIIHDDYKLKEFVQGMFEPSLAKKLLTSFEFIDYSVQHSPEAAFVKFKDQMVVHRNLGEQKNIWDY